MTLVEAHPDLTLVELRGRLAHDMDVKMSWSMVRLWFGRLVLRPKKNSLDALERDSDANRKRRQEFIERIREPRRRG